MLNKHLIFLSFYKEYNDLMDEKLLEFLSLNKLFSDNGFSLYMVGGTVRDYLLGLPLDDMDVVTDAKPDDIKNFLPDASFVFARFGSVSYKTNKKVKFDITTLREEKGYEDARHPDNIHFVKDLSIDVKRRDFTVNALYMDSSLKVIDYVNGEEDLKNRILRMVGNPDLRIKEDPLRIIRALRFSIDYNLKIDEELDKAIRKNVSLLEKLNIQKIKQDIKKIKSKNINLINKLFEEYNIKHLIDVIN